MIRLLVQAHPELLRYLFLLMLKQGWCYRFWTIDIKIVILKPGKPDGILKNLRPIALICILLKCFEKMFGHVD